MKRLSTKKVVSTCMATAMVVMSMTGCGTTGEATTESGSGVTVVKVGTGNEAAPFCYLDENGEPIGYDLDVLHELDARLEEYEFDIQAMSFPTLIVSLDSGALDMLAHELVASDERKAKYLIPDQYYCLSPMCLAVRDDSGITGMADMAGKTLDQNPSAYEYQMLMTYNENHPGEEVVINAVTDQSTADGFMKVSSGQVDAALTYNATFASVIPELGIENLVTTDVVMCEDTYMLLAQGQEELCAAISATLKEMLEDGTLSEISMKWYGEDVFCEKYQSILSYMAK